MFYNQLMKLCEARGTKPTPVLRTLGMSAGNLHKWKTGGTVNADTLALLSEYFCVPVDYFFVDYYTPYSGSPDAGEDVESFMTLYNSIRSNPEHISSLVKGKRLSSCVLSQIAEYMGCSPEYLARPEIVDNYSEPVDRISAKDRVLSILSKLPSSEGYKQLQVRISLIVYAHLEKKNISSEELIKAGLPKNKICNLGNTSIPDRKKSPFTYSDIVYISEKFNIGFDFLLTGQGGNSVR